MANYVWHKDEEGEMELLVLDWQLTTSLIEAKSVLSAKEDFIGYYALDVPERPEDLIGTVILVVYGDQFKEGFEVWLLVPEPIDLTIDPAMKYLIEEAEALENEDWENQSKTGTSV